LLVSGLISLPDASLPSNRAVQCGPAASRYAIPAWLALVSPLLSRYPCCGLDVHARTVVSMSVYRRPKTTSKSWITSALSSTKSFILWYRVPEGLAKPPGR
jgi:hypothetical protein